MSSAHSTLFQALIRNLSSAAVSRLKKYDSVFCLNDIPSVYSEWFKVLNVENVPMTDSQYLMYSFYSDFSPPN